MTSRTWRCEISKNLTWNPTLTAKNTPLFLFPYIGHSLQIFAWGMPRHAHVFSFTHNAVVLRILDVFTPKIRRKFLILTFLWIKTNVAYTRLEVIAKQSSALQVEFITGVKLICYFVLYYCFLQWDHLPNMAVGDLAFYYTLYLCFKMNQIKGAQSYFSTFFQTFWDFAITRKLIFFSLSMANFTAGKCSLWMILMQTCLVVVTIIKLTQ